MDWRRHAAILSLRRQLHRHHPSQALADLVGGEAGERSLVLDAEDGETARAFAGAESELAVRIDPERAWRLLGLRVADRGNLAGVVDGEAGEAVVAAIGDP